MHSSNTSVTKLCPQKLKFFNSNLTFIPTKIFENCIAPIKHAMEEFDISSSSISIVSTSAFKGIYGLKFLNISNNNLKNILPFTFNDGQSLINLDLSYNKLEKIDVQMINGLPKLEILDLSNNEIKTIERGSFKDLNSLNILKLGKNSFTTLDAETFGQIPLQYLYLNDNQFKSFSFLTFNRSLDTIDLSNNKLTDYVQNETCLAKNIILNNNELTTLTLLGAVSSLEAQHNKISSIELSTEIKIINLSYNEIKNLNTFTKLVNLREMDISFNEIGEFKDNSFELLENLEELYIQRTNLQTIPAGTFYNQLNLRVLDISYNNLQTIDFDQFIAMNILEELYIDGNSLNELNGKDIEDIFPELKIISISYNYWNCTYLTSIIKRMNSRHIQVTGDFEDEVKDSKVVMGIKCNGPSTEIDYKTHTVPSHRGGIIKQKYEDMYTKIDILLTKLESIKRNSQNINDQVILVKTQLDQQDKDILNIKPIFPAVEYSKQFEALNKQMEKITTDLDQIKEDNLKINENINIAGDSANSDLYAKVNSQNILIILIFVSVLSFVLVKMVKFIYVRRVMFNRLTNHHSSSTDPIIVEENL